MTKETVQKSLSDLVKGKYSPYSVQTLCDRITWLWKWQKITREEMHLMTLQARYLLGGLTIEEEEELNRLMN